MPWPFTEGPSGTAGSASAGGGDALATVSGAAFRKEFSGLAISDCSYVCCNEGAQLQLQILDPWIVWQRDFGPGPSAPEWPET